MAEPSDHTSIRKKNLAILKAILKSRKYAAYYILWVQGLKLLLTPLDILFALLERLFLKDRTTPKDPMIFVVGPHRSGTTFIGQVLDRAFPFHAIGNFNSIFHRSTYLPHRLVRKMARKTGKPVYRNFYGIAPGLFTIGDAHEVWDRWYGEDHSVVPEKITPSQRTSMNRYFGNLEKAAGKPLITKSGRNSMFMEALSKAFPQACFIVVERDLSAIVRSTLEANETFFGDAKGGWGLWASSNTRGHKGADAITMVSRQCLEVQQKVDHNKATLSKDRFITVDYEGFCKDPKAYLEKVEDHLAEHFGLRTFHDEDALEGIGKRKGGKQKDPELLERIEAKIEELKQDPYFKDQSSAS